MGPHYFGLLVDSIHDSQEIVVKPLSRKLAHLSTFSGSTILGTGDVVLILDPNNFPLQLEGANPKSTDTSARSYENEGSKSTLILLFRIEDATKAVPLALVGRIDELEGAEIQKMNDQYLFLYRDQLIPILGIKNDPAEEDLIPVLIFFDRGYKVALKIDEILDIVEDSTEIQLESDQTDSLGTAVIKGKATTIIDCQSYFKKAYPHWQQSRGPHEEPKHQRRLLLVDDSTFFLNLISPLLKVSGYCVETAASADQALSLCKHTTRPFDVIISDIEMPDKTGYDFLRELREDQTFDAIPVVALSGRDTEEEIQKAKAAGFKAFVPKTDQQNLIRVLAQL
jgi:two-component system chemotaxis sensor kinase CheA